ncbi:hypothetical protein AB839_00005, partial [Stenotrophomonas sp. DDT-1]
ATALTDVEVLQASLATCSLKRASYLFMYPSGLDLMSNSRGSLPGEGALLAKHCFVSARTPSR